MNQYKLLKLLADKTNPDFAKLLTDITDDHVTPVEVSRLFKEDDVLSGAHLSSIQHALNNGNEPEFAGVLRQAHEFISQLFSYIDADAIAVDPAVVEEVVSEFDQFDDLFNDEPEVDKSVPAEDAVDTEPQDEFADIFGEDAVVEKEAGAPFDRATVSSEIDEAGPWDDLGELPPMAEGDDGIGGAFEMGGDDEF